MAMKSIDSVAKEYIGYSDIEDAIKRCFIEPNK